MKLSLINLHPSIRLPLHKWRRTIRKLVLLTACRHGRHGNFSIRDLNVVFSNDSHIARLNQHYLRHQGATDVLTFDYGEGVAEIFISLDTSRVQARKFGQTLEQELTLYLAHGILHLAGLHDDQKKTRDRMRREEEWLLQRLK